MKVLVIGSSGIVGRVVAEKLYSLGYEVYGTYLSNDFPSDYPKIRLDITNKESVMRVLKSLSPDWVVHTAAIASVDKCELDKRFCWLVNYLGTKNIAMAVKVASSRLLYVSTAYVFDGVKGNYSENDVPNPINFYGLTKYVGMENIKLFSKNNFPAYIFIISNVYGAHTLNGKKITKNAVINKFIDSVKENKDMTVYKPGTQARNFIHVKDVASAYRLAVSKIFNEKNCQEFCLAGNESASVLEISDMIKKYAEKHGYNPRIKFLDNPRKETLVKDFSVDISRIKEIGFESKYKIKEAIKEMFEE